MHHQSVARDDRLCSVVLIAATPGLALMSQKIAKQQTEQQPDNND
jgi:hypothetical protein